LKAGQEQTYAASLVAEAKKDGIEKTAAAHHLQVVTTEYLPKSGAIAGLPDGSKLLAQAFSVKPKADPAMASTGQGYAIFQVEDVKAAHAPTFEEYKAKLVEDFRDQQLPQLLARKTNELAAAAKADNDLDKAAKAVGATIKTSDLVGKDAQVPELGALAQTAPQIFDMTVGQISGPINTGHSGAVAKLIDKQSPSADDIAKNLETTKQQMVSERREEAFSVFVSSLYDEYQKQGRIRMSKKAAGEMQPKLPG
jgi:peptidyl-prolyl cis-trans isomerase D